ncbi:O-antigen ligase family protein [Enterococcus viikkiensis]|uniref:O-antigen ligase family protein n=1 Tax=Enterococcus viikkiensis TaxID=930854 RepID=UPI001FE5FDB7|nr:O-antigen ligase family protein [Enterococcus viikkiensis]
MEMIQKRMFQAKGAYLLYFEIVLILRAIGPYLLLPGIIDTILFWSAGLFGIILIIVDFLISVCKKNIFKYDMMLALFIVVILFSSVINIKYGYFENIKLLMWQSIFFFLVFQFSKDYGFNKYHQYFERVLTVSWFFIIAISLWYFVVQNGIKIPIEFKYYPVRIGWLGNRLFGIFTDPNFGAVISVVVIFIELKRLLNGKKKPSVLKILMIINIVFQYLFIILSGSRTAYIVLLAITFLYVLFVILNRGKGNREAVFNFNTIRAVSFSLIAIIGLVIATNLTEKVVVRIPKIYATVSMKQDSQSKQVQEEAHEEIGHPSLERPDTSSSDISNMRFDLWDSAIQIAKKSPLVGGSPGYYIQFAHDRLPNTLMGRDNLTAHNLFFLVLASTGILGVIVFFVFIIKSIFKGLFYCFSKKKNLVIDNYFYEILIAGAIAISSLFITELVLVSTIGAFLFWSSVGLFYNKKFTILGDNNEQ